MTDTSIRPATLTVLTVSLNCRELFIATAKSLPRELPEWLRWVVVDGGSTDGTVEAIRAEPRVTQYVTEEDGGVYEAYNKAWRLASSDYVLYLNCGDTLSEGALRLLHAWHSSTSTDSARAVHCFPVVMSCNQRTWHPDPDRLVEGMSVPTPGVLFPKAALDSIGGFDQHLRIASDFGALLAIKLANWRFQVHSEALTHYLGGGLSQQHQHLAFFEECMLQLRQRAQTPAQVLFRAARRAILDVDPKLVPFRRWRIAFALGRRFLY